MNKKLNTASLHSMLKEELEDFLRRTLSQNMQVIIDYSRSYQFIPIKISLQDLERAGFIRNIRNDTLSPGLNQIRILCVDEVSIQSLALVLHGKLYDIYQVE